MKVPKSFVTWLKELTDKHPGYKVTLHDHVVKEVGHKDYSQGAVIVRSPWSSGGPPGEVYGIKFEIEDDGL